LGRQTAVCGVLDFQHIPEYAAVRGNISDIFRLRLGGFGDQLPHRWVDRAGAAPLRIQNGIPLTLYSDRATPVVPARKPIATPNRDEPNWANLNFGVIMR
jgi:hypothetical protein